VDPNCSEPVKRWEPETLPIFATHAAAEPAQNPATAKCAAEAFAGRAQEDKIKALIHSYASLRLYI